MLSWLLKVMVRLVEVLGATCAIKGVLLWLTVSYMLTRRLQISMFWKHDLTLHGEVQETREVRRVGGRGGVGYEHFLLSLHRTTYQAVCESLANFLNGVAADPRGFPPFGAIIKAGIGFSGSLCLPIGTASDWNPCNASSFLSLFWSGFMRRIRQEPAFGETVDGARQPLAFQLMLVSEG